MIRVTLHPQIRERGTQNTQHTNETVYFITVLAGSQSKVRVQNSLIVENKNREPCERVYGLGSIFFRMMLQPLLHLSETII